MAEYPRGRDKKGRQVPDFLLDEILGKDKTANYGSLTKQGKPRMVQKKSMLKQFRKSGGRPPNPRGGRFMNESIQHQLRGPVGSHPDIPKDRSSFESNLVDQLMRSERKKTFKDEEFGPTEKVFRDTIDSVGKDKFMKMDFGSAAGVLGMEKSHKLTPEDSSAYSVLTPKQRTGVWNKVFDGASAADAIRGARAESTKRKPTAAADDIEDEEDTEDEEE
jgi:hypothetical protein